LNSQKIPHSDAHKVPGEPLVHVPSFTAPISGKGEFQLPKNKTVPSMLTSNIIAYSPSMITAHRNPLYSVWKPATSSDSASGRSKGARLHSASVAIKKITQTGSSNGILKRFQLRRPPTDVTSIPREEMPKR